MGEAGGAPKALAASFCGAGARHARARRAAKKKTMDDFSHTPKLTIPLSFFPLLPSSEQATYRVAAIAATVGFLAIAATAVHARFSWHRPDGDVPTVEAAATLLLALGGVVSRKRERVGWLVD